MKQEYIALSRAYITEALRIAIPHFTFPHTTTTPHPTPYRTLHRAHTSTPAHYHIIIYNILHTHQHTTSKSHDKKNFQKTSKKVLTSALQCAILLLQSNERRPTDAIQGLHNTEKKGQKIKIKIFEKGIDRRRKTWYIINSKQKIIFWR